jgi:hypothetical protein
MHAIANGTQKGKKLTASWQKKEGKLLQKTIITIIMFM